MTAPPGPPRSSRRDDFLAATRRQLAGQVGWLCSNPKCRRLTVSARQGQEKLTSIGVAAHIAAASGGPGAARYDPTQTPEERRSIENGIWLCAADAKIIDDDPATYTVQLLHAWKADAKHRAFLAMSDPLGQAAILDNASPADDAGTLFARFRTAAVQDLSGFKRGPRWPAHPVSLALRADAPDGPVRFTAETLARAASVHDRLILVAPPGTGKSTTLIQLSDAINAAGDQAAVYAPLGEWSIERTAFLDLPLVRDAYRQFTADDVRALARGGRLRLILDGWNELDDAARKVATTQVLQLGREFPLLGVVISTRKQALDLPFSGEPLTLEALDEARQRELARSLDGARGEAALEYGWRTPGLSELVSLPLYLTALIGAVPAGQTYPETKDGVLALMVEANERAAAAELRTELDDRHRALLVDLAVALTRSGQTYMADDQARPVFFAEAARAGGALPLQPTAALDLLVARHALVRAGPRSFAFQHHQFQEWFASFEVERLLAETAAEAREALRHILDDRRWEEPVLFACERLSRTGDAGVHAVATAVEDALGIDPMLAGAMIQRSHDSVWACVAPSVSAFARAWHRPDQADRALRFMMTTGRPEFADILRPFLTERGSGRHFHVLRLPERFHPALLGANADADAFLASLGPGHRGEILAEIVDRGGVVGIDYAVAAALAAPEDATLTDVSMALLHRGAERALDRLLSGASANVLQALARRWLPEDIEDPALRERLLSARADHETAGHEIERFRRLGPVDTLPEPRLSELMALIEQPDYPIDDSLGRWLIDRAFDLDKPRTASAIIGRMEAGLKTPYKIENRLRGSGVWRDDGPLIDRLLETAPARHSLSAQAVVAGPGTISTLLARLIRLEGGQTTDPAGRERFWRQHDSLVERLGDAEWSRLEPAILALDEPLPVETIARVVDVLARALRPADDIDDPAAPSVTEALRARMAGWATSLLEGGDALAEQRADLAQVIGLAHAPLIREVEALYIAEADRQARLDTAFRAGAHRVPRGANTIHTSAYHRPLVGLGDAQTLDRLAPWLDSPRVAVTTAHALAALENRLEGRQTEPEGDGWRARLEPRLKVRLDAGQAGPTSVIHGRILASARRLFDQVSDPAVAERAGALARIALALPHRRDPDLIETLLGLSLGFWSKLDLLSALVRTGETLTADTVRQAVALFHSETGSHFHELDRMQHALDQTLALFVFADVPGDLLPALAALEPFQRRPYALSRLLDALGASPRAEATVLLEALARTDSAFVDDHGWRAAVLKRGTEAAAAILLPLIEEGLVGAWRFDGGLQDTGPIAERLRSHPDTIGPVWDLYQRTGHVLLRRALVHAGRAEIVTALIAADAARGRGFDHDLEDAVYQMAVTHRPYGDTTSYEIVPVEAAAFRAGLFHQALEGGAAGALAATVLDHLDALRDDYGAPQGEPRHPDLATGRPWPFEASAIARQRRAIPR